MARNTYTVSQINTYIKELLQRDGELSVVFVQGEVTNLKDYKNTSGHMYFSIKDEKAQLPCVMFRGDRVKGLDFELENGMEVLIGGTITMYERDGRVQLYAKKIREVGDGAIARRYEELKKKLEEKGYFDSAHKKKIPRFAKRIGIVTAKTGAVIHDIETTARRRNPYIELLLVPSAVQGAGAAEEIAAGIRRLDKEGVDVIIIGRGGGSMEDLWAFNEECVAKAVYACETPIVSAVGHETDFSISDFVADMRAATPTAAAELTVFEVQDVLDTLNAFREELSKRMDQRIQEERMRLDRYQEVLIFHSPERMIARSKDTIFDSRRRLGELMRHRLEKARMELSGKSAKLDALSPLKRLQSGFAYVTDPEDQRIDTVKKIKTKDEIRLIFSDGSVSATVDEVESK